MFPVVTAGKKPKSLPAFIVGGNGIFLRKQSAIGITQAKVDKIGFLPTIEPALDYQLPVIPAAVSAQIAGFLLAVDRKHGTEGIVLLCLDENKQWQMVVPEQEVSSANTNYFMDEDTIPPGWTLIGTCHSHPFNKNTAPVASTTDEDDERKMDGVHLVAGSLDHNPKYSATVVSDGTRWKYYQSEDIIEPAEPVAVPAEWLERVTKKSWIGKVVSYVTGGPGYSYTGKSDWEEVVREGETPEQALIRCREYSLNYVRDTANALGFTFEWNLIPRVDSDAKTEADEGEKGSYLPTVVGVGDMPDWKKERKGKGKHKKHNGQAGPIALPPFPTTQGAGQPGYGGGVRAPGFFDDDDWQPAVRIKCEDKHPTTVYCPFNCGCHCEPCRTKTVGAFDAKGVEVTCACNKCKPECYTTLWENEYESGICNLCKNGKHLMGTVGAPYGEGW